MKGLEISVVIPSIGRSSIHHAIDSVRYQTLQADEIIVVHDIPKKPPFLNEIDIHEVWTRGICNVCMTRNIGAILAKSNYVAFLDDDDYWLPKHLEICYTMLCKTYAEMICTAFWIEKSDGKIFPEKTPPPTLKPDDFYCYNPGLRGSNLFINRSTFMLIGGFDPLLPSMNDLDFGIRAADSRVKYLASKDRTVVFRQHDGIRLSTPNSKPKELGIFRFWKKYNHRMKREQRNLFIDRAQSFWNVKPENMKKMILNE